LSLAFTTCCGSFYVGKLACECGFGSMGPGEHAVLLAIPSAQALPGWWENAGADLQSAGSGQFTRPTGGDPPAGQLEIPLENSYVPDWTKHIYFVLDWSTTGPGSSGISQPVWSSWESPVHHYHSQGIWTGGNLVTSSYGENTGVHRWEYDYRIFPQPNEEWARLDWLIDNVEQSVDYSFDFRSKFVPRPGTAVRCWDWAWRGSRPWLGSRGPGSSGEKAFSHSAAPLRGVNAFLHGRYIATH
jgi:hypothetical protein